MRKLEESKGWKRFLYSPWTLVALLIVFLVFAHATWRVYWREVASAEDKDKALKALAIAQENNTVVQEQIDDLQTASGMDEEIRRTFNVAKQGEGVAVIIPNSSSTDDAATSSPIVPSWWQRILNML